MDLFQKYQKRLKLKLYALPSTIMYSVIDMDTAYITHTTYMSKKLTENTYAMFSQTKPQNNMNTDELKALIKAKCLVIDALSKGG